MIEKISTVLIQEGLIKSSDNLSFNFLFTRGTCIVAEVTGSRSERYFIKFSEISRLADEYHLIDSAGKLFPRFVPKQFGYFSVQNLDLIVTERVRFRSVQEPIVSHSGNTKLRQHIRDFLTTEREHLPAHDVSNSHRNLLDQTLVHLEKFGLAEFVGHWIKQIELENLPGLAQHGDFVHNNLGIAGDKLYVFDWEDFGKVLLPGFDMATLVFADTGFNAEKIVLIMNEDSRVNSSYSNFIEACCLGASIDYKTFLKMLPLHLAVFCYLKREYGEEIQTRVRDCLKGVFETNR